MPLKQRLVERTEGNPFFLEESVRTLVETGALVGAPGTYRLAQAPPTMQVPATVQAVLAARIDRLPLEEKRLLQTAAVIGTEVPLPLLCAIAELPEAALQQGLAHLQAAEFLYVTRLFPEYEYTFKHALTHEVAYGSLLLERLQALHARILGALEALARDRLPEQVEPLAYHALRGKVWDKALVYARQAGEKAMARSAHHEAVRSFEQALRVLPQLPETRSTREQALDLRFALRSALRPLGEVDRLLAVLEEAEALAAALNDPRRQGQVALFMSQHYRMLGRHDEATAAAQRTLALATASGDGVLQALTNQYLGLAYHVRGDYRRAIDCLMQTIALLDGAHRHERFGQIIVPAVNSRAWIAVSHAELGQFPEGRVLGDEGLQLAEALAHPDSLLNASRGVGLLALRQGDTPRALHVLERAMDIGRTADVSNTLLNIGPALGAAYTLTGRVAAAVPLLTQVLERIRAHDMGENLVFCSLSLGEAYLQVGQLEEAYALVERALAFARAHQERGHEAYALRLFGEIDTHRTLQDGDAAATHYQQALKLADELGMRPLQAHCHCSLGTLYAKISRREQAHAELATALELYRAMTMTCWLPQAEAALARVEGRP
jgi:tetratricopeptide (TPR) repeat protein